MALGVVDDRFGAYTKTLPDLILIVLAKEYPLRVGEVVRRLRENFGVRVTFQAVRKALGVLVERKCLVETDRRYAIERGYVLELKRLGDQMLGTYYAGDKRGRKAWASKAESLSTYTFDTFITTDQFCNEVILEWAYGLTEGDDRTYCFTSPHYWYVFGQAGIESGLLRQLRALRVRARYLCEGDTPLDRWTKAYYDAHDIPYAIARPERPTKTTMGAFGDFVVQYEYPDDLYERIERFYRGAKDLRTLDLAAIAKLLDFKTTITFTVLKNRAIAERVKAELRAREPSRSRRAARG